MADACFLACAWPSSRLGSFSLAGFAGVATSFVSFVAGADGATGVASLAGAGV